MNSASLFLSGFTADDQDTSEIKCKAGRGEMQEASVVREGILSLFLKLCPKESHGPYDIPAVSLKRYAEQQSYYLYIVFQNCMKVDDSRFKVADNLIFLPGHQQSNLLYATLHFCKLSTFFFIYIC